MPRDRAAGRSDAALQSRVARFCWSFALHRRLSQLQGGALAQAIESLSCVLELLVRQQQVQRAEAAAQGELESEGVHLPLDLGPQEPED